MGKEKNGKKWLGIAAAAVAAGLLAAAALMIFTARRREQMEEYLDLGARYMNDLNYEDAIVAFQKAVDIDPRNKEAAIGLAGALEGDGQYEQAEAVYLTVTEKYPAEGEAYVALAELYIRLGRQDEARELLAQAVSRMEDEEVVRLKSHIVHMRETLGTGDAGIGRKLDFIAQEMNREANTILSKANDLDISNVGIDLKTEIEKVREQIQNIE